MNLTPYPRLSECVRALALALDTKAGNRDVDRLAREGDLDWSRLDGVIEELLVDGSRRLLGPVAEALFKSWLLQTRSLYCLLVLEVPLDAIGRRHAMPVLVEEFLVPQAAQLLVQLSDRLPGPDLSQLLDAHQTPLAAVFDWLDTKTGSQVEKLLYPQTTGEAKSARDKIGKWRNGVDLPSAQSLKLLKDDLCAEPTTRAHAETAGMWLLIARALAHFDRQDGGAVRPLLLRHILAGSPIGRAPERLQSLVLEHGASWPELTDLALRLWHDLRRTSSKPAGEQARTWKQIQVLEQRASALDPEGRTAYHYAWMKGRWHSLSGEYEEAVPHYEHAFGLACYRAGDQIKEIVEDAICIAAFLEQRVFVKQLKQVGIVLGLFARPRENSVVEPWEMERFNQQLLIRFPPQGRFVEGALDLADTPTPGFMTISLQEVEAMKPDLKSPNRARAVSFGNGVVRRWPQLRLFASFGMHAKVRTLLEAGASVDELDSSGGSALLCAIQHAESGGDRAALGLLLAATHQATTLNAMTNAKRLTPLMCAVDLGEPDVVLKLLDQGADADLCALTDRQSPMYYTVTKLFLRQHPHRMFDRMSRELLSAPDAVLQDTLRRFGVTTAGAFGSDTTLVQREPELALTALKGYVDLHVRRYSVAKLQEIVKLLLRFGADPNRGHSYPVRGYTPLMLAAESDLPSIFDLMVEHGGDPLQPDAQGRNCMQIAREFHSMRILSLLQRRT